MASTTFSKRGKRIVFIPTPASGLAPNNTVAPVASGTLSLGNLLSCTTGTWVSTAAITYSYQWQRNSTDIPGAIFATYTVVNADLKANITCLITAANRYGVSSKISNTITSVPSAYKDYILFMKGF